MAGLLRLRWRGQPRPAVHQRRGAGDRAPEGKAGRDAARARVAGRQDRCPGGQPPFGPPEVAAMSRTVSPSSSRPYGLARVCRVWRASRASVYRHLSSSRPDPPRRPGPVGPMPDPALVDAIRAVLTASPFHGEGHRKVWARLRVAGLRTSKRRVLRLMRANNLLVPSRVGAPRGPRNHDGTIIPATVDTMWGTDLTTIIPGEGQAAFLVAVDHCSAECVGIQAARRATRFEALEPIRQGVRRCFGGFAQGIGRGLAIRHDHGSQYMSDAFQQELAFLGIASSPAFVRAPEGNGCAERFIRTLKENLLWVRTFDTVADQGRRMKSASQKSEHVIIVPGGLLATRPHADPGCSVPPHEVDGDLAQDGQVARCRAIPDAAVILAEGDIEDPMEPIFNRPVPADRLDQHRGVITAA